MSVFIVSFFIFLCGSKRISTIQLKGTCQTFRKRMTISAGLNLDFITCLLENILSKTAL